MDWNVALRIFLIVVIGAALSGLVAFLGNKLGRHVGRRKMSVFGLRPKYTSNLITVATGCLIYMATLGILAAFFPEVRQLLVGLKELEEQRVQLEQQVTALDTKVRAGPAILPFQPLSVGVVEGGLSQGEMREQIEMLLQIANERVLARNNQLAVKNNLPVLPDDTRRVGYVSRQKDEIINALVKEPKGSTFICEVWSGEATTYYGDETIVQFMLRPNPVVFRKGQVIASRVIDGRGTTAQVYKQVYEFIYKDVNFTCLAEHDMIRNPLTNKLDTELDNIMMQRAAEAIAQTNRPMRLQVVANSEIHPLGPLDARLVVTEK